MFGVKELKFSEFSTDRYFLSCEDELFGTFISFVFKRFERNFGRGKAKTHWPIGLKLSRKATKIISLHLLYEAPACFSAALTKPLGG